MSIHFINKGGKTSEVVDITTLDDYIKCEEISEAILGGSPYIPLYYVQSAGEGEYVDTRIIPTSTTEVEVKFEDAEPFLAYERIFSIDKQFGIMRNDTNRTTWRVESGGNWGAGEFTMNTEGIHTLKMGKGIITLDGKQACTYSGTTNTNLTLWLFHGNGTDRNSSIKLYYCNIYENSRLVRSFIPCKDINGNVCLFDKVNSKFYYNSGTGNFIAGEVI